jgi:hypothetical protein
LRRTFRLDAFTTFFKGERAMSLDKTTRGQIMDRRVTDMNGDAGDSIHLFQNDVAITPDTVVGDLVEADFGGYAASAVIVTWHSFYDSLTGDFVAVPGVEIAFAADNTITTPQTVYGWWLSGGSTFYRLDEPFTFTQDGDTLVFEPRIVFHANMAD